MLPPWSYLLGAKSVQERRERRQRAYKKQERDDIRTHVAFWKVVEV